MSRKSPATASHHLHPDDLIDDREVTAPDEDRLAHQGIVDQLASLAIEVKTPSNIALYGPWGSGKSGIANLLRDRLRKRSDIRFVRFDAFKYADVPLRRNFISAVAKELECNKSKYHADLYSGRTKTDVSVPASTIVRVLGIFAALIGGLAIILGIAVAIAAWLQEAAFWTAFRSLAAQVILASLLPASLLAALISLGSKSFTAERSLAKPESDEQFEQLFTDLVAETKARRLIIFVDELDRCSADEVVATLDTVRTFLGIDKCVFIIAADQRVLEEALTTAAKQETPPNEVNPYYSTGSAYLDKVFQYQIGLPPLLVQSVSKYAESLVEDRGGIWHAINTKYVLSVLIPTHVTSPRRVKHLLNTFALTYRLAENRYRSGLLAEDPSACAPAIARLVCLRVEFPLFARDLELHAKLPDLVLKLMADRNAHLPSNVSPAVQRLARAYALESAAPATILSEAVGAGPGLDEDTDEQDDAAAKPGPEIDATVKEHNRQLLNYLSRTRQIEGPSRDLVHMQSSGTVFGLDGEIALSIERAAEDVDVSTLKARVESLDADQKEGALNVLAQLIRTGSELTGPNAARSLLLLTEQVRGLALSHMADSVIENICILHDDNPGSILGEDTVASAWALAKDGSEAGARALRSRVISVALDELNNTSASEFLIDDAVTALEAAPVRMSAHLTTRIVSKTGTADVERIFGLADEPLVQVLSTLHDAVTRSVNAAVKAHAEWESSRSPAPTTGARTTQTARVGDAPNGGGEEPYNPTPLFEAFCENAKARETPVQEATLRLLLHIDCLEARNAAAKLIRHSEATRDPNLSLDILTAAKRRVVGDWVNWLRGIDPTHAIGPSHQAALGQLATTLFQSHDQAEDACERATQALAPLINALPTDRRPVLTSLIRGAIEDPVTDPDEASKRMAVLASAGRLARLGLADPTNVAESVLATLQDTLACKVAVADHESPLYEYIVTAGTAALTALGDGLDRDNLRDLLTSAADSPWLDDLGSVALPLALLAATGRPPVSNDFPLPAARTVAELLASNGLPAASIAKQWVDVIQPGPADFATVLDALLATGALDAELAESATRLRHTWSKEEHSLLLEQYLPSPDMHIPSDLTLRAIGLAEAEDGYIADLLCTRYAAATNNNQRQAVIDLWWKASIREPAALRRLIETVVYGLLDLHIAGRGNVSAVDLALTALERLGSQLPYGVKVALSKKLGDAITGNKSLEKKALRVLPRLGYKTLNGRFGKTRKVDFSA